MQLLHIADLHFGRLLYGRSLMDDQRHFVRQSLLPALDEYKPDALLVAGDLYDRQIASVDAIHLFDELIDALITADQAEKLKHMEGAEQA